MTPGRATSLGIIAFDIITGSTTLKQIGGAITSRAAKMLHTDDATTDTVQRVVGGGCVFLGGVLLDKLIE